MDWINLQTESPGQRRLTGVLAGVIAIAFFCVVMGYWSPGTNGGDHNGYLLGGKFLASGKITFVPPDPYVFMGNHWVEPEPGRFTLKFAPALPAMYAIIYRMAGPDSAPYYANLLSPVCAALAVLGTFLLLRVFVSSFCAILGMLAVAVSPVTLVFAFMPNSHAYTLCVVVWGMYVTFSAYVRGGILRAMAGGLILGYAATVRYTEGLLVLPLILAIFLRKPDKTAGHPFRENLIRGVAVLTAWFTPVLAMIIFNLIATGHLNGYALTHENTGFALKFLLSNWATMLIQLNAVALFIFFPLSILGLILMFRWNWRVASILAAWIIPPIFLYTAYYWAPQGYVLVYMRFILPTLPGLALAAVWLLNQCFAAKPRGALIIGVIAAIGILPAFRSATVFAEDCCRHNRAAVFDGDHILRHAPEHSLIFTNHDLVVHIQTRRDYQGYLFCGLSRRYLLQIMAQADAESEIPSGMQSQRTRQMIELATTNSDAALNKIQNDLIRRALDSGKHVYVVLGDDDLAFFQHQFLDSSPWRTRVIDLWCEDTALITPGDNPALASDASPPLTAPIRYQTFRMVEIFR